MRVALIGFSQSGKSTLAEAISGKAVPMPGSTAIEEAVVSVPDGRLDWLTSVYNPKKTVHASITCLDVPGIALTDEKGRKDARTTLGKIRTADMLVLVVRAHTNPAVPPYRETVDAKRDVDELLSELLFADMELVTTRIERLEEGLKKGSKTKDADTKELELQKRILAVLEEEKPASTAISTDEEEAIIRSLNFLTLKPVAVVVNAGDDDLRKDWGFSIDPSIPVVTLSATLEQELSQLDDESRHEFMAELGIDTPAAGKFVASCYQAMGMISFLTVGPDEVRAWPIEKGTIAVDAAGKVHSDIKRGFIRAEKFSYADLKELGSEKEVRAAGKVRLEGKQYVVEDGDIIDFRFNV